MPEREDAMVAVLAALDAEPKPITSARALEVARATLSRPMADQFTKWFGPNGARLLEKLNA